MRTVFDNTCNQKISVSDGERLPHGIMIREIFKGRILGEYHCPRLCQSCIGITLDKGNGENVEKAGVRSDNIFLDKLFLGKKYLCLTLKSKHVETMHIHSIDKYL